MNLLVVSNRVLNEQVAVILTIQPTVGQPNRIGCFKSAGVIVTSSILEYVKRTIQVPDLQVASNVGHEHESSFALIVQILVK